MRVDKGLILMSVISAIFLITSLTFAQEQAQESAPAKAEEQVSTPPATVDPGLVEAAKAQSIEETKVEPQIQWVWGEVVSTNPINNELLVKYVDYNTDSEKEITISTDAKTTYENAKSIDEIKVRDSVSVDYEVSADGKNLALNISLEKPEATEETSPAETAPAEVPNQKNTEAAPDNTAE